MQMDIQVKQLNDGRFIGLGVFEVASFPMLDGSSREMETELEQAYNTFLHTVQEFYNLGQNSNTVAELLWIADRVEKQTFRSRIRIFCVVRKIHPQEAVLKADIEHLLNHFILSYSSKQFTISAKGDVLAEYRNLIGNVSKESLVSVVKSEKCAGNALSIYPYYFTDVVPANNTYNFSSVVAAMSQYENCCISFQVFPTQLTPQERLFLNEVSGELARLTMGVFMQRDIYKDISAQEPYAVLSYYLERINSPLFLYNILVFGKRSDCISLASKIVSAMQSGNKKIMNPDFTCLDLTREHVDLNTQYMQYPWNINNKLIYTYRNKNLLERVPMAKMLFRLPYIMTAEYLLSISSMGTVWIVSNILLFCSIRFIRRKTPALWRFPFTCVFRGFKDLDAFWRLLKGFCHIFLAIYRRYRGYAGNSGPG